METNECSETTITTPTNYARLALQKHRDDLIHGADGTYDLMFRARKASESILRTQETLRDRVDQIADIDAALAALGA